MSGRKLPSAEKYKKRRKNMKLWHRLLLAAGCVVVFVTTYMLILPAITAEVGSIVLFDESVSSGGSITPEETDSYTVLEETTEASEETSDNYNSGDSENAEETGETVSEETSDQASEKTSEETAAGESSGGSESSADSKSSEEGEKGEDSGEDSEGSSDEGNTTVSLNPEEGVLITLTAEEQQEELSITETVLNQLLLLSSGSGSAVLSFSAGNNSSGYLCEYDSETNTFTLELLIEFTLPQSVLATDITSNTELYDSSKVSLGDAYDDREDIYYTFDLPSDVILTDDLVYASDGISYSVYNGYQTGTTNVAFKYYFVPQTDSEGNTYYTVVMVFDSASEFISGLSGGDIEGEMTIEASASAEDCYDEGKVVIKGDGYEITIPSYKINYSDSSGNITETVSNELITYKSVTKNSDGTLTYTLKILTSKGTGDPITITDVITNANSLAGLDENGLVSITYTTGTIGANTEYNSFMGEDSLPDGTAITKGDSSTAYSGSAYYYYDSDGNLMIVLPGLSEPADGSYAWSGYSWYTDYNEYIIEYTYKVDPDISSSYYVSNTATANSTDSTANVTLTSGSTSNITVTGTTLISKYGSYSDSTITWTVTLGDGTTSLEGYTLTDSLFSSLTASDLTITRSDGTASGSDYEINYDSDSKITGITFNAFADTKYTITYTQTVTQEWDSATYTNTAEASKDGTSYSDGASVTVGGTASSSMLNKDFVEAEDNGDGTYTLNWKTDFIIPEGGIPAGVTFTDLVDSSYQYITYDQAKAIVLALKNAFGTDVIEDIYFNTKTGNIWYIDSSGWVSADALDENEIYYMFKFTTAVDITYSSTGLNVVSTASVVQTALSAAGGSSEAANTLTAVVLQAALAGEEEGAAVTAASEEGGSNGTTVLNQISLGNSVSYDGNKVTIEYSTTAKVSDITDSRTFTNTVFYNSGVYSSDSYTYAENVVKYGINNYKNLDTGSISLSTDQTESTVEWVVKVVLSGEHTSYTVTDVLPEGVELTALSVSNYNNYNYTELAAEGTTYTCLSDSSIGVSYNVEETTGTNSAAVQNVTVNITDDRTDKTSDYTVYIKYTCKYTTDTSNAASGESIVSTLTNTASVKADGTEYGTSNSQTTTVTYTETTGDTGGEALTKDSGFDKDNNILEYTLDINPDAITYTTGYPVKDDDGEYTGEEYADLTIVDVLTYYTYPTYGIARNASLVLSSVKVYYAKTNDDGTAVLDDNGKLVAGTALESSEYSWTYSEDTSQLYDSNGKITNTITLIIPNSTALVFEYNYLISVINTDSSAYADHSASATNSATLKTDGYEISTSYVSNSQVQVSTSATSASANGGAGYTIYKVDRDNFSLALSDAVFDLYVYNGSSFTNVGSFTTGSTGYTGISGTFTKVVATDQIEQNGAYLTAGDYYKITLSDGSDYYVPVDTMCYFVESAAPDGYKVDDTKHYFFFGSAVTEIASGAAGYDANSTAMAEAINIITSHTEYITNSHSSDYYSEKTNLSVIKTWVDSDGTEYKKTDGSVSFNLYRIFTYEDGTVGYSPSKTTQSGDQTAPGSSSSASTTLTWYWTNNDSDSTPSSSTSWSSGGTASVSTNSTVDLVITVLNNAYWCPAVTVVSLDDDNNPTTIETLAANDSTAWDSSTGENVHTFKNIQISDSAVKIGIYFQWGAYSTWNKNFSVTVVSNETETTTETQSESVTETSTETTTAGEVYTHFFDTYDEQGTDADGNIVYTLKNNGYDGFFTISGNLSYDPGDESVHGVCAYDLNGDGYLGADDFLHVCLKIESKTSITFTPKNDGYLLLGFNASGGKADLDENGKSKVVNGININGEYYPATDNQIYVGLTGGTEYTLTKKNTCYLFYMSFTEEDISSSSSSGYLHSFNNGKSSDFYSISGNLGISDNSSYGTVTYNGEAINQFLKMGSSAKVTFTAPEDGILYLVLTNAKKYNRTVGVTIDGVTREATDTGENDTLGFDVYLVTVRISAGSHTITRINSTEYQLYYMGYVPDDYANAEVIDYTPYSEYAELVGTYTLSYSNDWSWSSVSLPLTYVSSGNDGYTEGEIVGYYTYYVVEVDEKSLYITQYKNVTNDGSIGISAGTMGIINQLNENSPNSATTHLSISKEWYSSDNQKLSAGETGVLDKITADIYAKVHVYTQYAGSYTAGTSNTWDTSGYSSDTTLTNYTDGIYTLTSSNKGVQNSDNVRTVTYNGTSYTYYLKFDSSAKIVVDAPATQGTLSLITANFSTNGGKDIGFNLTSPSGTVYKFNYSSSTEAIAWTSTKTLDGKAVEYNLTNNPTVVTGATGEEADGVIVFTIATNEAGEWILQKGSGTQAYLFSIDYAYQYQYLTDDSGVYVGSYTITADDSWKKTVSSLPLYVYNDDGDIIGYYSYYIEETYPTESDGYTTSMTYTMELSEIVTAFELGTGDSGNGVSTDRVIIYFSDKSTGDVTSGSAVYTNITYDNNTITAVEVDAGSYENYMAVTKGSVAIKNTVKEQDIILPEAGGDGRFKYILAGLLISFSAGLLLYKRSKGLSGSP